MIVCICKGVSSKAILAQARRGPCTLQQIQQSCQAGTECGACIRQIRQLITSVHSPSHEGTKSTSPNS